MGFARAARRACPCWAGDINRGGGHRQIRRLAGVMDPRKMQPMISRLSGQQVSRRCQPVDEGTGEDLNAAPAWTGFGHPAWFAK